MFVKKQDLNWIAGRENVQVFEPAALYNYSRCFCKTCGTSLGEILSDEDSFPIAANAPDGEIGLAHHIHDFVPEKPGWYEICDGGKQFERASDSSLTGRLGRAAKCWEQTIRRSLQQTIA